MKPSPFDPERHKEIIDSQKETERLAIELATTKPELFLYAEKIYAGLKLEPSIYTKYKHVAEEALASKG